MGEFYSITLTKPEEIKPVRALVEALKNPHYRQIGARAIRVLTPLIEDIQKPIDCARGRSDKVRPCWLPTAPAKRTGRSPNSLVFQ